MRLALVTPNHPPDAVSPAEPLPRFPCSASQERFWFVESMDPGNPALNVALRWEIKGALTARTIEEAFAVIVERHEPLRTRIVESDGLPLQEVQPPFRPRLRTVDLSGLPEARQMDEVVRLGSMEAETPFDIDTGPLLRITLLRLGRARAFLLVTVHHIAFDGWSIRLISREFGMVAAAIEAGRPHGLPELDIHYGDYAAWQSAFFQSKGFEREAAYWTRHLRDMRYFEVLGDHPRQARPAIQGEILAEIVPKPLSDAMTRFIQAQRTTAFVFGCAVIASVLRNLTGRHDITFGTQVAGRDEVELDPLIGVFINTLVLHFDLSGAERFSDVLSEVRGTVEDALVNQRMPFHRLVALLKPARDARRTPLFSVNFTVLHDVMEDARYGDFDLIGHPSLSAGALYDLNFFMVHWPGGWRIALEYNTALFDRSTAQSMLEAWRVMLGHVLDGTDPSVSTVPSATVALHGAPAPEVGQRSHGVEAPRAPGGAGATASLDDTCVRLLDIWREVLANPALGPDNDFFDAGGHSIVALRMLSKVEAAFGKRIGVANLFTAPTVRGFASLVRDERAATADWAIVPIQSGGRRVPLIVLNNTIAYRTLAKQLGGERPVIGVQLFDPQTESTLSPREFKAIATDYVALIRKARPSGPYLLMGLCVAGTLAYEVARQLRAEGEDVPLVIMADTWRPGYVASRPWLRASAFRLGYRWHVARHHWQSLRRGEKTWSDVLGSYPLVRRLRLLELAARLRLRADAPVNREDWGNRWFLPHLEDARSRYVADPGAGTLLVLRSDEFAGPFGFANLGWTQMHADRLLTADVPGWHITMFEERGASRIADLLQPFLAAIDRSERMAQL